MHVAISLRSYLAAVRHDWPEPQLRRNGRGHQAVFEIGYGAAQLMAADIEEAGQILLCGNAEERRLGRHLIETAEHMRATPLHSHQEGDRRTELRQYPDRLVMVELIRHPVSKLWVVHRSIALPLDSTREG